MSKIETIEEPQIKFILRGKHAKLTIKETESCRKLDNGVTIKTYVYSEIDLTTQELDDLIDNAVEIKSQIAMMNKGSYFECN